ncbi:MAG: protein kinase [Acidobacteriota bacterium]
MMDGPERIGRYRLTRELGRGGMGVVYEAEDPQLGRSVAIKVILFPQGTTDDLQDQLEQRFEREARAAAAIHHPGVVTVFDFGRDGDYLFLVMELVDGRSLAERLKSGWRPQRAEAFDIVAQVADALAAAHASGVVHRDVTPRNILLAQDGRVLVTDFGIARSMGEETLELTRTGMLVGSPSFMAPEQVRNLDFDERADLFSLGVVLYLLLTARLPFDAKDLTSLLYQIVHEDPFAAPEIKNQLGVGALALLERCLAKGPEQRVRSAEVLARQARELAAAAAASELEATVPLGQLSPEGGSSRRKTSRQGAALFAVLVVAAAGIWRLAGSSGEVAPPGDPAGAKPPSATAVAARNSTPPVMEAPSLETATSTIVPPSDLEPEPDLPPEIKVSGNGVVSSPPTSVAAPHPEENGGRGGLVRAEPVLDEPVLDEPADRIAAEVAPPPGGAFPPPDPPEIADTVAPILALDEAPRQMSASRIVLTGRVMDDRGAVDLTVDGEAVPIDADGDFTSERSLAPGRNVLVVSAIDAAGNRTLRSVEVTVPAADVTAAAPSEAAAGLARATPPPVERPAPRPRRFADRGDGTLSDGLTGLMWTKRANGSADTLKESRSYCRKLELGRQEDWQLPTIEELEELFRAGSTSAAGPASGALSFPAETVWSESKKAFGTVWVFDFGSGQRREHKVRGATPEALKILCMRREAGQRPQRPGFDPALGPEGGQQLPDPRGNGGGGQGGGDPRRPPRGGGGGRGG